MRERLGLSLHPALRTSRPGGACPQGTTMRGSQAGRSRTAKRAVNRRHRQDSRMVGTRGCDLRLIGAAIGTSMRFCTADPSFLGVALATNDRLAERQGHRLLARCWSAATAPQEPSSRRHTRCRSLARRVARHVGYVPPQPGLSGAGGRGKPAWPRAAVRLEPQDVALEGACSRSAKASWHGLHAYGHGPPASHRHPSSTQHKAAHRSPSSRLGCRLSKKKKSANDPVRGSP